MPLADRPIAAYTSIQNRQVAAGEMAVPGPPATRKALSAREDDWLVEAMEGLSPHDEPALLRVAGTARPLPDSLAQARAELEWIRRRDAGNGPLYPNALVLRVYKLRARLLEGLLLSGLPAKSLDDIRLRLDSLAELRAGPEHPPLEAQALARIVRRLRNDLDAVAPAVETTTPLEEAEREAETLPATRQGRTATERRAAVISYLCDPERGLWSDRAIARACGVSPQTVGNWRRKLSGDIGQLVPDDAQRVFARGGRIHHMNTASIGTRDPGRATVPRK